MADHNRTSVDARAAGRMVLVRSHAERIVVLFDDEVVADHPRQFRRDQIVYDPYEIYPLVASLIADPPSGGLDRLSHRSMSLKKLRDFFEFDMLNLFEFERFLVDRAIPRGGQAL